MVRVDGSTIVPPTADYLENHPRSTKIMREVLEEMLEKYCPKSGAQGIQHRFQSLPEAVELPERLVPKLEDEETAENLSQLLNQLRGALDASVIKDGADLQPGESCQRELLDALSDYVRFMTDRLRLCSKSFALQSLDAGVSNHIRTQVIPGIRKFCEQYAAREAKPTFTDDELAVRIDAVHRLRDSYAEAPDVSSRKVILLESWNAQAAALELVGQAFGKDLAPRVPDDSHATIGEAARELTREEEERLSAAEERCAELRKQVEAGAQNGAEVLAALAADAQDAQDAAEVDFGDYEKELEAILALIVPRMQSLSSKYSRARNSAETASAARSALLIATQKWEGERASADRDARSRIDKAISDIALGRKVLESFEEALKQMGSMMCSRAREQEAACGARQEKWGEAGVQLLKEATLSLHETRIKNETLLEEWQREEGELAEEMKAALERLDSLEETRLKREQAALAARTVAAHEENARIAERLDSACASIGPLTEAIRSGHVGVPIPAAERVHIGLPEGEWAFRVGAALARDLTHEVEAYAVQHRQQRLDFLRRKHKRSFEALQEMKERIRSATSTLASPRHAALPAPAGVENGRPGSGARPCTLALVGAVRTLGERNKRHSWGGGEDGGEAKRARAAVSAGKEQAGGRVELPDVIEA